MRETKKLHSHFVVPRYWPGMGGAEQHTRRLIQEIADRVRISVSSHCSTETAVPEIAFARNDANVSDDEGTEIHQLVANGISRSVLQGVGTLHEKYRAVRPFYAALHKHALVPQLDRLVADADLVHAVYNGSTATAEAAAAVAERQRKPFVLTPLAHTTFPGGTNWSSRQFRRLYQRASALIAMTGYERDWLANCGADPERIFVCPVAPLLSGVADPQGFRERHQLQDKPVILFLGRLVDYKGYRALAEAGAEIWNTHPDAQLVYAGPHSDASRAWFESLNEPRIHYLGVISDAEKSSALAACELLCVPSTEESLGVSYLEAWSFGKPVVAADIPVLRSVISDQQDGLLCAPSAAGIACAVKRLLDDPRRAAATGAAGREKVARHYQWSRIGDHLIEIYRGLV